MADTSDDVMDVTIVFLEDGFASTAVGPAEILHSAGRFWNELHGGDSRPRFRVRIASIDGKAVISHYAHGLIPQCSIDDIRQTDIIIVTATGLDVQEKVVKYSNLLPWLQHHYSEGAYVAGICAGAALLAECGLLDGRRATTHWALVETLCQRYPQVQWQPEEFVTEDCRLLSCGGVYAALDLGLYLVDKFCGHEIALQCAKALLLSLPRSNQAGYAVLPLSRPHSDAKIQQSERYLQEHFNREVSIEMLASDAGITPRTFIRRFKAATGRLPGAYLQMLRVSAAKDLLEKQSASIQSVASMIGYEDVGFFRNLFKRHTGMTPSAYRGHFGKLNMDRTQLATGREEPHPTISRRTG